MRDLCIPIFILLGVLFVMWSLRLLLLGGRRGKKVEGKTKVGTTWWVLVTLFIVSGRWCIMSASSPLTNIHKAFLATASTQSWESWKLFFGRREEKLVIDSFLAGFSSVWCARLLLLAQRVKHWSEYLKGGCGCADIGVSEKGCFHSLSLWIQQALLLYTVTICNVPDELRDMWNQLIVWY